MLRQISERCWYMSGNHETDRPSLGYVRGDRHALLVDCGNSPAHLHALLDAIRSAGLPCPSLAVVTHAHWDHVYGMCALEIPVITSEKTQDQLIRMEDWRWTEEDMIARLETREDIRFCHDCILKEYRDPQTIRVRRADIVFSKQLALDLGGCTAKLLQLPNSHADDCTVINIPEERVLFTGDITYMDLHADPPCWHMQRRAQLVQNLHMLPFDTCVPGHEDAMAHDAFFDSLDDALMQDFAENVWFMDD